MFFFWCSTRLFDHNFLSFKQNALKMFSTWGETFLKCISLTVGQWRIKHELKFFISSCGFLSHVACTCGRVRAWWHHHWAWPEVRQPDRPIMAFFFKLQPLLRRREASRCSWSAGRGASSGPEVQLPTFRRQNTERAQKNPSRTGSEEPVQSRSFKTRPGAPQKLIPSKTETLRSEHLMLDSEPGWTGSTW